MPSARTFSIALVAAALTLAHAEAQNDPAKRQTPPAGSSTPASKTPASKAPASKTPPKAPGSAPAQSTPATAPAALPNADLVGYRLPLLREGSVIANVIGDITLDPDEQHWVFRPLQSESGNMRREFVLLPSSTLEEMLRTRRLSPSPVEFEVTGRVFIYKGRNYLFPELAPPTVRFDTRPSQTPSADAKRQETPNGQSRFVPPPAKPKRADPSIGKDDDATVEGIERRLEQRVGRTPVGRPSGERDEDADTKTRAASVVALPEPGTRLVLRSGKIARDPESGSWRFVPEQVSGKGDASMEILPCLLLERLEAVTRDLDSSGGILISGTVVVFEENAYLLPTSFRRNRDGRGIGR